MSDKGTKGVAEAGPSVPEVETYGKGEVKAGLKQHSRPRTRSNEPEPWHRTVTHSAANLRKRYGPVDRDTADRMTRIFRAAVMPRKPPGRKPSKEVLTAVDMLLQNRPWVEIYPEAIDGYSEMPFHMRNYRSYKLRRAVAAYMKRRGIKRPVRSPHKNS